MIRALAITATLCVVSAAFAEDLTLSDQVAICEKHRPACKGPASICMNNPEFDFSDPDLVAVCHKRINDYAAKKEAARKAQHDSDEAAKLKKEPVN